ncbi:DUF418 domain-containing protein [Nonomuraea longicatena]|uniref:DUF418 domain-containing protein n=2 Tax=Nonomuraea longicatena TaxID=83682 RepID=A0ABP3ZRR1_9ACTN
MLLLIAVANTPWYLWGRELRVSTIHPPGGSALDRAVQVVALVGVDFRVYPMFAFLFGYGMARMSGDPNRRNVWLLVFGFLHAALLWQGDILGAYGLAGLLLAKLFFGRDDRTLLRWAAVGAGVLAVATLLAVGAAGALPTDLPGYFGIGTAASGQPDPAVAVLDRLLFWSVIVTVGQGLLALALPVAIVLGFWAARQRVLEEPGRHLPLLRRVAVIGIAIGWLGGLPHAAAVMGWLPGPMTVYEVTQLTTGLPAGLGYAAVFGLIGHRISRPGPVVTAVAAVGRRSLSAYLAQSLLCAPVLAAWGLGLGARMHSASMAAYAVGVWLVTVAGAVLLDRRGLPGPAEIVLRRLRKR